MNLKNRTLFSFSNIFPKNGINAKMILYYSIIGVIAGLGAALFLYVLEWSKFIFTDLFAGRVVPSPAGESNILPANLTSSVEHFFNSLFGFADLTKRIIFFILPALGGLVSGIIVYTFAPEAEGHGTDAYINSFHNLKGYVRGRVPFVKSIASIITLSTGGSGGREGPIAQIGSGFGSFFGRVLKLSDKEKRNMLIAGTAGGLGAIFRAPLGSALTSVEVLYKEDFESDAIVPAIIASVTSFTVFTAIYGHSPIFSLPFKFEFSHPIELIFYLIMSILCGAVGYFYVKIFHFLKNNFFASLKVKRHYKPAIGGLFVGLIGLVAPEALGDGWGYIQKALNGEIVLRVFITLALCKILATSFTIGSGGSAGVFGPTLFIGAMLGGATGIVFHTYFPTIVVHPETFILVGMASFFAGVAKAPLAALIMVCEMTGGYGLIAPLMIVGTFSIMFLRNYSIYEKQVGNKFDSPAHLGDMRVNILQELKVGSVVKREDVMVVHPNTTLGALNRIIEKSKQICFPVLSREDSKIVGIISIDNVREVMFEQDFENIFVIADVMMDSESFSIDMDLHKALTIFLKSGYTAYPVIDSENKIIGMLRHSDIIGAYNEEINKIIS